MNNPEILCFFFLGQLNYEWTTERGKSFNFIFENNFLKIKYINKCKCRSKKKENKLETEKKSPDIYVFKPPFFKKKIKHFLDHITNSLKKDFLVDITPLLVYNIIT